MSIGPYQIDIRRLFVPCIVCGEENRFLDMFCCVFCEEPICKDCFRQDGFCSDECHYNYSDEVNANEDWGEDYGEEQP